MGLDYLRIAALLILVCGAGAFGYALGWQYGQNASAEQLNQRLEEMGKNMRQYVYPAVEPGSELAKGPAEPP